MAKIIGKTAHADTWNTKNTGGKIQWGTHACGRTGQGTIVALDDALVTCKKCIDGKKSAGMVAEFQRTRLGKSTYVCECCGRNTRETGLGESGCNMCAFCYEAGGISNSLSDGHITDAEANAEIAALTTKYGKRAHVGCG